MDEPEYEVLDWSEHGIPPDTEVRAWAMGILTFHRGKHQATIDTTDMTREEVVRSIAVAMTQLDIASDTPQEPNRKQRRAAHALNGG